MNCGARLRHYRSHADAANRCSDSIHLSVPDIWRGGEASYVVLFAKCATLSQAFLLLGEKNSTGVLKHDSEGQ